MLRTFGSLLLTDFAFFVVFWQEFHAVVDFGEGEFDADFRQASLR